MDDIEIIEELIISLLGVDKRPLNGKTHLQKEIFLLTESNPKLKELFNFKKHYYGPYSQVIDQVIEEPFHKDNPYEFDQEKISLSYSGRREFQKIGEKMGAEKFAKLKNALSLIRTLYHNLDSEEILLIIYATYPKYVEKSSIIDNIIKKKDIIIKRMLSKKSITELRAKELMRCF